jgi:putative ABC transport system substrate-binding protein
LPYLAQELTRKVGVIVALGNELTLKAARQATTTIPIVMIAIDYDPLALGYVASLARPEANITGVFLRQPELTLKRLELLTETLPHKKRIALLWDALSVDQLKATHALASSSKTVEVRAIEIRGNPPDVDAAIREAARGSDGAVILASTFVYRDRDRLAQLPLKHRLPTILAYCEFAEAGGLMTYGADLPAMFGRAAEYVDKILRGAKAADLPVEQPTKFELIINLKTLRRSV